MVADALRMYGRLIGASIRAQMQYRASFLLAALGMFMINVIEVVAIWALFERFGTLGGVWTLPQVAFLYGVVNITFPIAEALSTGFDTLGNQLRLGEFDRVLLRPRTTVLQLLGHELALRRVGRLAQGAIVFAWAVANLEIDWNAWRIALLLATVIGGVCMFLGLVVLQATACFWTIESIEAFNAFTYGGAYAAQYPMTIYAPWFRRFFTYVVPLALVTYFPMLPILGREDPLWTTRAMQVTAPLAGVVFLSASLFAWGFGVRKHTSTGS